MDQKHRNLIIENVEQLSKKINYATLEPKLIESRIFTSIMISYINSEPSDRERVFKMLIELPKRGPNAFRKFVAVLVDAGFVEAALILDNTVRVANGNNGHIDQMENIELQLNRVNMNRGPIVRYEERSSGGEGQMKIEKAAQFPDLPYNACYKMESRPRGHCLLINNVYFGGDDRKGSDADSKGLDMIFDQLGFKVKLRSNKNRDEMLQLLTDFANLDHSQCDAAVLIFLSHGEKGTILGVDGQPLAISNIIKKINNINCKGLAGKPKMCFIQACRGSLFDHGTPIPEPVVTDARVAFEGNAPTQFPVQTRGHGIRMPHISDLLLSFSTVEGYVSNRNEIYGTWYGRAIVETFIEIGHYAEINEILNMIDRKVKFRQGSEGQMQATDRNLIGWDKSLYFNPGLYR